MIDINNLYQSFTSMANTNQGGFFRPVRDFVPAVHAISLEIFNELCKHLEKSEEYSDMLLPFFMSKNIIIQKEQTFEYAPWPADYSYWSSAKILTVNGSVCASSKCQVQISDGSQCVDPDDPTSGVHAVAEYEEHEISAVVDSKFGSASRHRTKRPTLDNPIGAKIPKGFKILPKGVGVIMLNYYRNPLPPVYNYTTKQNGVDVDIIYNSAGSRQLEWDDKMMPVFMYKLMMRYGIFIDDQLKMQVQSLAKDLL